MPGALRVSGEEPDEREQTESGEGEKKSETLYARFPIGEDEGVDRFEGVVASRGDHDASGRDAERRERAGGLSEAEYEGIYVCKSHDAGETEDAAAAEMDDGELREHEHADEDAAEEKRHPELERIARDVLFSYFAGFWFRQARPNPAGNEADKAERQQRPE